MVSGFNIFFCWDSLPFFVRLRTAAPLWGGSDVVRCVRVSLTGTTMAMSSVHWSLVGDWFGTINTHSVTFVVGMGPL